MCDDELRGKKLKALIPPSSGARYWSADYAERNQAVANQRVTGDNTRWKSITGYHRRSIAVTARYRVKQLFGGHLSLRDYDGQVAEALAMICALNKMPLAGMPESARLACKLPIHGTLLFQIRFIQQSRSRSSIRITQVLCKYQALTIIATLPHCAVSSPSAFQVCPHDRHPYRVCRGLLPPRRDWHNHKTAAVRRIISKGP